jgi:serine/threonine protein kinase
LLPASLSDFVYRNGLTVDSGEDFDHHIHRLVSAIDKLLSQSDRVGSIPHSLPAPGGAGAENAIKPRYREDRSSTGDQGDVLPPGCVLGGKYEVGRLLGRGGFGATYLAWDANLRVRIAIKEFLPRQLATRVSGGTQVHPYPSSQDTFSIGLDQFLSEARNLAQFRDNPGICSKFSPCG